ncbi:MAG: AbrB/MazE/SpoVT family DNA-binding domain-containing protein [Chloroflexi bacterium]|nr:AbrB/MazE/SpoVT family DNA-binding domain-containing protein [Chloroflexota bacterium]MBI3760579.1 AbrB/MazE/SpoVT family DNA-binding domain-containing protein [Chloroflexota bacterium]
MNTTVLQIQGGNVTLPAKLRARYKLQEGDTMTLVDLGGVFVLSPKAAMVPKLAAELERRRKAVGLTVADLLEGLDEQRRIYAKEQYGISTAANSKSPRRRRRSGSRRVLNNRG